ncbi:MAG: hypothetical protein ACT4PY_10855 [Armatimonadota bacterium]
MPKLWSELPGARAKEVIADAATVLWMIFWIALGLRLYDHLAPSTALGRTIRSAGIKLESAGQQMGDVLMRVPAVGRVAGDGVRDALTAAGAPLAAAGGELERALAAVVVSVASIVLAVPIVLWLERYLPWRLQRLRMVRAAHRAIRVAPRLEGIQVERLLASRAIHRLSYEDLLAHTPDPLGDWASGRHEGLARAELASVGLRPLPGHPREPLGQARRRRSRS